MNGFESVFKIRDGEIYTGVDEIERVSEKRYAGYYPGQLFNPGTFEVTDEIGKYYAPLFGKRRDLGDLLPGKLKTVNVFPPN